MLKGAHQTIAASAAVELMEHADVTPEQFEAAIALDEASVGDAMVRRASRDADWAAAKIQAIKELNSHASTRLLSRLLAVSTSPEELKDLDENEPVYLSYWVARTIQDPGAFKDAARQVLDGTSEFLNARTGPLKNQYAAVADYLTGIAKAAACDVLATVEDPEDQDLKRVADELRRNHYVSRESALRAVINIVRRFADTSDEMRPELGDLSVLGGYNWEFAMESVLESPIADKVVPIWRKSGAAALRTAAQRWELQHTATEETLEDALYEDDASVRIFALDQLLARWDDEQLEALFARYDQQQRAFWYNVIAALDEHLYGYSSAVETDG